MSSNIFCDLISVPPKMSSDIFQVPSTRCLQIVVEKINKRTWPLRRRRIFWSYEIYSTFYLCQICLRQIRRSYRLSSGKRHACLNPVGLDRYPKKFGRTQSRAAVFAARSLLPTWGSLVRAVGCLARRSTAAHRLLGDTHTKRTFATVVNHVGSMFVVMIPHITLFGSSRINNQLAYRVGPSNHRTITYLLYSIIQDNCRGRQSFPKWLSLTPLSLLFTKSLHISSWPFVPCNQAPLLLLNCAAFWFYLRGSFPKLYC